MTVPRISVLIPFRNAGRFIDQALTSIADQTFRDFEVVLVNDRSTDSSLDIAHDWCRKDPRFRIVENSGAGIVDALNSGLRESDGDWIARMDADDIALPRRLEKQFSTAMDMGERTVVSCRVRSFPDDLVSRGYRLYEKWLNDLTEPEEIARNIFVESPIPHPTAFYHRVSVAREGGYMERELPEDYELWLRLWSRGFRFRRIPEVLLEWRDRPDRFSRISSAYSQTSFYRLKARYLAYVPCLAHRKVLIAGSGQAARRLGRCLQKEGFEIIAFMDPDHHRHEHKLRGRPIRGPEVLTEYPDIPILVASRLPGARDQIRSYLQNIGLSEWKNFVICS